MDRNMDSKQATTPRKALSAQYKDREVVGGVYLIRNTLTNKVLLESAADISAMKNRFEFSQNTGTCVYMKLQKDWTGLGGSGFTLEVLEELRKNDSQTDKAFKADVDLLKEIWLEKLSGEDLY